MSELLIAPYEISVWDDVLIDDGENSYYKEKKIAVIGSNTMTGLNRVYSPVLIKDINGEKTLTFSLKYRYFDEDEGEYVKNPFVSYLINERKIKLKYDEEWYDFIIKECQEDTDEYTFSYTAIDAFANELAKTGYNVVLNTELNNNLGSVTELAERVLEGTDWVVDKEDTDLLRQTVSEPIYECVVEGADFQVLDIDEGAPTTISVGENIKVFYSYIANKEIKNVQFLRNNDIESWTFDDKNAIHGKNYRILEEVSYNEDGTEISLGDTIIRVISLNSQSQGYRLVYAQKTTYDPIMERTVDVYEATYDSWSQEIYGYKESVYTTSSIVLPLITNGSDYNIYTNGSITGWSAENYYIDQLPTIDITSFPKLDKEKPLVALDDLGKLRGAMEMHFPASTVDPYTNFYPSAIYNSGFTDNASLIHDLAQGEEYVFRIKYGYSNSGEQDVYENLLKPNLEGAPPTIRAVVAQYTLVDKVIDDIPVKVKKIDKDGIYLDFTGEFKMANNMITGGRLVLAGDDSGEGKLYILDGVPQAPSLKYIYHDEDSNKDFIWNPDKKRFVLFYPDQHINYFYTIAKARRSITNAEFSDPGALNVGIFIYNTSDVENYSYVEDIQIFKYYDSEDGEGTPILPGNAPEGKANIVDYFYLKPSEGLTKDNISTYASLATIANEIGIQESQIKPLRNENCEKILSVEEGQSNRFNILQSLCETFECWLKINVAHEQDGSIKLDDAFKPIKKIAFKEYVGKENFAGFRYGINVKKITRTLDSNEFVTKLIVGQPAIEYVDGGTLSIANAKSNPSKESYILNFNYYLNQGLIENKDACLQDITKFYEDMNRVKSEWLEKTNEYKVASTALTKAKSSRAVFVETFEKAAEDYADALTDFSINTGMTYEEFRKKAEAEYDAEESSEISEFLDNETVREIIGRIYTDSTILNSYGGLVTNIKKEYNKLNLSVNGMETYNIVVSTSNETEAQESGTKLNISGYIEGFKCNFYKGDLTETFESKVNLRTFYANRPYELLIIEKIPEHYHLQYMIGNELITSENPRYLQFKIYDTENDKGLTRRLVLVPDEEYAREHTGCKERIKQLEKEKEQIEKEFNSKYSSYIKEGTWESTNYIDPDLYYLDATQVSNTSAQPKVTYDIEVAEISEIEGYENYKFEIGDKTYIEDPEFFGYRSELYNNTIVQTPIQEEVIVSNIEWHLDEPDQNVIKIQNYKTQFEDLFQRISASVQSLEYNKASYMRSAGMIDMNGYISAQMLSNSINAMAGNERYDLGGGGVVSVTEEGLLIQDLTKSQNFVMIKNGGINISTDGGANWKEVLSGTGINADTITAGTINTQEVLLMDGDNPSFRWDKMGLNAYGFNEDEGYDLTSYVRFDKFGLYGVKNGDKYVCQTMDEVWDNAQFGVTWNGFFIKNRYTNGYISIEPDNDIRVVRISNYKEYEKIKIGALAFDENGKPTQYGLRICDNYGNPILVTNDYGQVILGNQEKSYAITAEDGFKIYTNDAKDITAIRSGRIDFTKNNIYIGQLRYAYFDQSPQDARGYGLVLRIGYSTNSNKPCYTGLSSEGADGLNYLRWIYVQENAGSSMPGYTAGELHAGANINMRRWQINNLGKLTFNNGHYLANWADSGIYTDGPFIVNNDLRTTGVLRVEGSELYDSQGAYLGTAIVQVDSYGCPVYYGPILDNTANIGNITNRWRRLYSTMACDTSSDRKLKDNIKNIDFAEDLILNLNPVTYMLKSNSHRRKHMGFIAQDAIEVCKDIGQNLSFVSAGYINKDKDNPEKEYLGEEVDDEFLAWGISYEELIAPTIKVVQNQNKKIKQLEEQVSYLTQKLDAIEKEK